MHFNAPDKHVHVLLGDQGESERLLASGVGRRRPCCCPEIPQHQKLTGEQVG